MSRMAPWRRFDVRRPFGSPLVGAVVLVVLAGCASPRIEVDERYGVYVSDRSPLVVVEEFELATQAERYTGAPEWVGIDMAQSVVKELRRSGVNARLIERDSTDQRDRVVRGRIVRLDGGSVGKRLNVGMGAGGGFVAVEAEILDASGRVLDVFSIERRSSRALDSSIVIERAVRVIGRDVAEAFAEETAG